MFNSTASNGVITHYHRIDPLALGEINAAQFWVDV